VALSFQDEFNVSRLKPFRDHSLKNPKWLRDPDHVLRYLSKGTVPTADETWPEGSALAAQIGEASERVRAFRRYASRVAGSRRPGNDPKADELWSAALAAIDALILDAERVNGGALRTWR
jgi:hypothetical protein